MQYRTLGKTGFEVSGVVYGGIVSTDVGQQDSDRSVSWSIDRGVNYFDVAPTYGDAEEKLGNSLKPYRKDVYLACKTTERSREGALKEINRSLELLHTDWFDVFQLHSLTTREDVEVAFGPGGIMELLRELKEKGAIRKLGFSAHSEYAALEALSLYDFDTVLFPTSYQLDMGEGISRDLKAQKAKRGFGFLGMKSLIERAWLNDQEKSDCGYPKSWCKPFAKEEGAYRVAGMKYALTLGADVLVPPGNFECYSFMVDHVDEVYGAPLSQQELDMLRLRYQQVKDHPFFLKNNGGWHAA